MAFWPFGKVRAENNGFRDMETLRTHMVDVFRKQDWVGAVTKGTEPNMLELNGKGDEAKTSMIALDNLLSAVSGLDREAADDQIAIWIETVREAMVGVAFDRANIIPSVRHYAYLGQDDAAKIEAAANAGQSTAEVETRNAFSPLMGDLVAMLVIDTPNSFVTVTREQLSDEGLSMGQALDIAVKNLPSKLGEPQIEEIGNGIQRLSTPGLVQAAGNLLFDASIWQGLERKLGAGYLLAHPSRHSIYVAPAGSAKASGRLRALIEEASGQDHYQSGLVFQRKDGWFVPIDQ